MQLAVRGYETQVKVFLILVVLFLVTANLVTVSFLIRSESLLAEEAAARAMTSAVAMARQAEADGLPAAVLGSEPAAPARAASRLTRLSEIHGAVLAEIVDGGGTVLASSQTWRHGSAEPMEGTLDPGALALMRTGRPALGMPAEAGDPTTAYVPLASGGRPGRLYLRARFTLAATDAISRQIQLLTWAQGIGGTVVLVMVLLFSRWVLRPYRELRATAESLEPEKGEARDAGDPAFLVASFRGVVEKMRSVEAELDRMRRGPSSAGGQESFLAGLSSGVLIVDAGGRIETLNPAGEAILELRAVDLCGCTVREVFSGSPEFARLVGETVHRGLGRSREMVAHKLASGRTVHLGVTTSSPPGGAGGALCLFSDLTEIRSVQARVLLKENLARLGELSAGIAHEFRNSLSTILGYARLVSKENTDSSEHAQAVIREVQTMDRLVAEFLRYAGPARLQKSEFDLREMLAEIAEEVRRGDGIPVEILLEGEWPSRIHADEALLRQAFHNLVRNAVEAARTGPEPRKVVLRGRTGEGAVTIDLTDSGPGFPPEILSKLFTPFVTTKERGTGLGMALAQKVIVSHDGGIEAGNLEEGGGRVTATLPL